MVYIKFIFLTTEVTDNDSYYIHFAELIVKKKSSVLFFLLNR